MSPPQARLELRGRIEVGEYPVDAAWSPDATKLAVAGGEGAVLVLDRASGGVQALGCHEGGCLALAWQSGGPLFASSGQDGAVLLWDARTQSAQALFHSSKWSEHLAFASHGKLLAVACGRELQIFDSSGALRHSFDVHTSVISALAWRPKSSEIAAVGNGGAYVHRLEPRIDSHEYPWRGACLSASWSPDARVLAAGMQDGSVHLWYVASATQSQMQGYGAKVALTQWSATGRYLATAATDILIIWDFSGKGAEGKKPLELRAHSERVIALAFRPTGNWLVSSARDRRVLLWRIGQGYEPLDAHLLGADASLMRWSADGRWLALGDQSGRISIFELNS